MTQTIAKGALTARECAAMFGIGTATWWRRDAAALCPRSIKHGRTTRWRLADLEQWIALGCPPRARFEALKKRPAQTAG